MSSKRVTDQYSWQYQVKDDKWIKAERLEYGIVNQDEGVMSKVGEKGDYEKLIKTKDRETKKTLVKKMMENRTNDA